MPKAPPRPLIAASLACFRDGQVLIARRGREPNRGLWSLPGGAIELGETAAEAATREFLEEAGAKAEALGLADVVESIVRDESGAVVGHAVILAFAGRLVAGEPAPGPEAEEIAWVTPDDLGGRDVTPGLLDVLAKAAEIAA